MANNTNWLNISSQSGSSGQTILTLSANKNLSTNYKTAEITAYNPVYNISAKTYVTLESYAPFLSISPDLFGVPDSGGTYELTINANCAWVIAFPDLVTSYSTSAGTGNAVITFTVPGTTADTTLVGNIVVTDESGQISKIAKVEQYGSGVHIGVFPVELYFDSTGGSQTFSVSADAAYNVSVASGTDWAFVEPNSGYTGQTVFTVRVNSGYTGTTDRQGVINIDAPGQDLAVILYQRKPETRLVTVYDVTSTTDPTTILGDTSFFSKAELANGTEITLGTGYTFPSTGNQKVYYTLTGNTVGGFENSTALTQVVIPEGVTEIADSAFASCTNLTYIKIPDTVTQVGVSAFSQCSSLSSITLPDSLERMESAVFSGCTSLSSITIPSAVTNIGSNCFSGSSVSSITFTSLTPPTLGDANALTSNTLSEIIVPCPAVNDYITAYPQYAQYISCSDTGTTLYFTTDTSNVKGIGETRTITILNTNINPNRIGLNLPSDFPQQGSYVVEGNVIYLTYPRNPSSSATRNWTIGVVAQTKDGVSLSGSYSITQNANDIYAIPYTADTSAVDASGETRTITIDTSNLVASSITIGIEGATGVTYTYENGVITITFPPNSGDGLDGQRTIVVTITGGTLDGKEAYVAIAYTQDYEYTGETRVFAVFQGRDSGPTKLSYTHFWSKVELADGTDITNDIYTPPYGQGEAWPQSGYGYDFGTEGNYGVYFTVGSSLAAYAFTTCNPKLVVIPDTVKIIQDEAFTDTGGMVISFGKGLDAVHRKIFKFSGVRTILFNSTTAPVIPAYIGDSYSNLFYDVPSGGTIFYPCGADYSNYTDVLENEHSWNSVCFTESGVPSSSYTYQAYLLGGLDNIAATGETRTFSVGGLLDDSTTYSYDVVGPSGMTYTQSGDTITVVLPQNNTYDKKTVAITVTATSYNGLFIGTGSCSLEQDCLLYAYVDITYNVTTTGEPTSILYEYLNTSRLQSVEGVGQVYPGLTLETGYTFPTTGEHTLRFYVKDKTVPKNAWLGCTDVITCTISEHIETVEQAVCEDLASLIIDSNYYASSNGNSIDGKIAYNFPGTKSISFGPNVTNIGSYTFSDRKNTLWNLTAITFTNSITGLSSYAFYNYHTVFASLGITLPDSITYIGESCFENCGFKEVVLPSGITSLPARCFKQAYNITSITIPDSVITIGDSCFEGITRDSPSAGDHYSRLKTVVIGSGVTTIGANAFKYVLNINNLYCNAITAPSIQSNTFMECGPASYEWYDNNGRPHWYTAGRRVLYHPAGSDYSTWMQTGNYYLGKYDWIEYKSEREQYLTFRIISSGIIMWKCTGNFDRTISYSLDNGSTWSSITASTSGETFNVTAGDVVLFKGDNPTYANSSVKASTFCGTTAVFEAEGNIMSLVNSTSFSGLTSSGVFTGLFSGCTGLTSAANLLLPGTTLSEMCYMYMFQGCTSLKTAPELPATTLANSCYAGMFIECTSLTTAPELPATTMAKFCYSNMFNGCTSLLGGVTSIGNSASTMQKSFCEGMFKGCTSLIDAPELPITTYPHYTQEPYYVYRDMFNGCTSLTTAPELPATGLGDGCYARMFKGCTALNYIKCLVRYYHSETQTSEWVEGVQANGTFVKNPNMSSWPTGVSGIPSGWTVVDAT